MALVMGRFVPLASTSTPEGEVEDEEGEEEEELSAYSDDAELSLPRDGCSCVASPDFTERGSSRGFRSQSKWPREDSQKDAPYLLTACASFKLILGFINIGEHRRPHLAFSGAQRRGNCFVTPAFSGVPRRGGQNHNWLPHPCPLGGPKDGRIVSLFSRTELEQN